MQTDNMVSGNYQNAAVWAILEEALAKDMLQMEGYINLRINTCVLVVMTDYVIILACFGTI